jgi:hypothetical protein
MVEKPSLGRDAVTKGLSGVSPRQGYKTPQNPKVPNFYERVKKENHSLFVQKCSLLTLVD